MPDLEHMFPTLTAEQMARIARHARTRTIDAGATLIDAGQQHDALYIVKEGELAVVRPSGTGDDFITKHHAGQFTGEINVLMGRPGFVRIHATQPSELLELDRAALLELIQTDADLSDVFMRAFLLRRVELIAQGRGDVVLVGSDHCSDTLRIREFLSRNGHPYTYIDLDRDEGVQALLDQFQVTEDEVPVVICRGVTALRNPTNEQIADCLGFNETIDATRIRDVVIIGAGPAGLAAAVYAGSEGLDVLVLESSAPGGQAGASSRIENYLGFPTGISGQELASRAITQAEKFGAQLMIAKSARSLACDRKPYAIELENGDRIPARTLIIATGAQYRKLPIENGSRLQNAGIYYGATHIEAQLCRGEEVIVIGGGNSAGQAAVFLADSALRVHVLVRADGLAESMSRYLVRRIEEHPSIELHTRCELEMVDGEDHLERVRWRALDGGTTTTRDIRHVFVMTGAIPATRWLDGCIALDERGFVRTGVDLSREELTAMGWPLARTPFLLETTLPGVFAIGDVRGGNVKRVASAVGEGAMAVSFVHRTLHE
ncbi:MAG TPA: FAD-dependent oxidoreductase [Thermoanaerobaculia bacterium]|jgi:thioredoxin reductase (NADPH)